MSAEQAQSPEPVQNNASERTADRIATNNAPVQKSDEKENVSHETKKPSGYYPVDVSDLPEEKQQQLNERFGYYHKQVKDLERKNRESEKAIKEWQETAAKQIMDLTSATTQIVDHMEARTIGEQEADVKKAMKEAFEAGDLDRFNNEQDRLLEIKLKKQKATAKEEKIKAKEDQPKNQTQQMAQAGEIWEAQEIARQAVDNGELTPEHAEYVTHWQSEKDDSGNLKRPWAFNPSGGIPADGSPMDVAMKELASIVMSPTYSKQPFERQLAELDRRMGVKQTQGNQTVLGGNLTRPGKANNIKLSPDVEKLAIRMKFAGPGKSDAEHVAAYRINAEKVRTKRSQ